MNGIAGKKAQVRASVVPLPGPDLRRLVGEVAQGSERALAEVYEVTKSLIFGLILRILGNHAAAEEVLLDVYLQAWRQAARYDAERGSPLAWLITIARSRTLDRRRADKGTKTEVTPLDRLPMSLIPAEEMIAVQEQQHVVRSALASLPPEQRAVIELAYYHGLTQTEIAARLGCPLGTVKTRTHLAMKKLREKLAALPETI